MDSKAALRPLLSIVIPTKNRYKYALSAIENIQKISDERVELVIQDNSDDEELKFWINSQSHTTQLVYNHSNEPLSFVGNFNKAIELCSGEYICVIGDDDGVNPEIVSAVSWLIENDIDCLCLKTSTNYIWPDSEIPPSIFTKNTSGTLTLSNYRGTIYKSNPQNELIRFLDGGCINYLNYDLPKLYHGIVRRKCLDNIISRSGSYFSGLSPDISIAISLTFTVNSLYITDYPLTLPGVCGVSGSVVEGLLKKNSKLLEDAPHFRHRGDYVWSDLVPRFYSVETIWADSAISALLSMGHSDLINKFNLVRFCAFCIIQENGSNKLIFNHFIRMLKNKNILFKIIELLWYLAVFSFSVIIKLFQRILKRLLILIGIWKPIKFEDLDNIVEASSNLSSYLNQRNENFLKYTKNVKFYW